MKLEMNNKGYLLLEGLIMIMIISMISWSFLTVLSKTIKKHHDYDQKIIHTQNNNNVIEAQKFNTGCGLECVIKPDLQP